MYPLTNKIQFDVLLDDQQPGATATARGPKVYKVTLTKVADINLE